MRGDHTVHHALGCGQICKGAAVDLCHHLAGVHLGGIHCQNDVRLVQTGQRHKGVHLGDALLAQQLGVRTVPVDDQHAGELLAHFLAAGRIAVDDGDALLDVLQLLDEVVGHRLAPTIMTLFAFSLKRFSRRKKDSRSRAEAVR